MPEGVKAFLSMPMRSYWHQRLLHVIWSQVMGARRRLGPAGTGSVPTRPTGKLQEGLMLPKGPTLPELRLLGHRIRSGL